MGLTHIDIMSIVNSKSPVALHSPDAQLSQLTILKCNFHFFFQDDPLSSLDNEVGSHVFEQCVRQMLLKSNRSIILVTQQLQLIREADYVSAVVGMCRYVGILSGCANRCASCAPLARQQHFIFKFSQLSLSLCLTANCPVFFGGVTFS